MKVTCFFVISLIMFIGCRQAASPDEELIYQQKMDSTASARIDSAYSIHLIQCDSLQKVRVPILADSIISARSQSLIP